MVYWLLVLPALVVILAFCFFPLARIAWISFSDPVLGFDNYRTMVTSAAVQRILWTTIRICVLTTLITVLLGYMVAYAMVHVDNTQRQWMLFCVLLTFWLSVLIRAYAWIIILRDHGPINWALLGLHLVDEPVPLVFSETGVVIGMVHYMMPYSTLPLFVNMYGIDQRLVTAARVLGATPWTAFWRIFLPLSIPGIVAANILVFIYSLGFYVTPAILGGGKVTMIAEYIGWQIQENLRWGLGSALASTLVLVTFVLMVALSRFVKLRKLFGAE